MTQTGIWELLSSYTVYDNELTVDQVLPSWLFLNYGTKFLFLYFFSPLLCILQFQVSRYPFCSFFQSLYVLAQSLYLTHDPLLSAELQQVKVDVKESAPTQKCKTQEQSSSLNLSVFLIFSVTIDTLFFLTVTETEFGYNSHSSLSDDSREFSKQFHCSRLFDTITQPFLTEHRG